MNRGAWILLPALTITLLPGAARAFPSPAMQTGGFVQTVTPDSEVSIDCAALAEEPTAAAMFALTITDAAGEIPYGWMTAAQLRSGVASLSVRVGPEDRTVETTPGVLGQFDMTIAFWPEREWSGSATLRFVWATRGTSMECLPTTIDGAEIPMERYAPSRAMIAYPGEFAEGSSVQAGGVGAASVAYGLRQDFAAAGHLFAIVTPGYGNVGSMTASGPEQQRYVGQGAVGGNAEGLGQPDPRNGTLLEETDAWTGIYFSEATNGTWTFTGSAASPFSGPYIWLMQTPR